MVLSEFAQPQRYTWGCYWHIRHLIAVTPIRAPRDVRVMHLEGSALSGWTLTRGSAPAPISDTETQSRASQF